MTVPALRMSPLIDPVVPPSPMLSVPAATVVVPKASLSPVRRSVPEPSFVTLPLPVITPP